MQNPSNNPRPGAVWHFVFFIIAIIVVVADQLTKAWIQATLAIGQSIPEEGFFQIIHVQNTGAAFGLFRGFSAHLTVISFLGAIMIFLYVLVIRHHLSLLDNRLSRVAMGLVLGGTIGNLIDRIRVGYVTDFIQIAWWPAFNVADSCITIGVIILVLSILFLHKSSA